MNRIDRIPETAVVFSGAYTRANIQNALKRSSIKGVHFLLQDWSSYPKENAPYRCDIRLQKKTEERDHVRRANLLEILHFGIRHPELVLKYGPVEGGDRYVRAMGKHLKIPLVIPYITFSGGKIQVSLDNEKRPTECEYKLVVTYLRYSKGSPAFCY